MHIYQPSYLILGLLMLPMGLLRLSQSLRWIVTRTFRNCGAHWNAVAVGAWFVTRGPACLSQAFDPWQQASTRTEILQFVAFWVLVLALLAESIAWLNRVPA